MLYDVNFLLVWKIDISLLTLMFLFVNVPTICICSTFLKLGNKLPSLSGGYITTEAKVQATGAQITTSKSYYWYAINVYGIMNVNFI